MKKKLRAEVIGVAQMAADDAVERHRTMGGVYHVLSIRFSDGRGIDIPYEPWRPKQTINIRGIYDPEGTPTFGEQS